MPKRISLHTLSSGITGNQISGKVFQRLGEYSISRPNIVTTPEKPKLAASRAGEKVGFKGAPMDIRWVKRFIENGIAGLMDRNL